MHAFTICHYGPLSYGVGCSSPSPQRTTGRCCSLGALGGAGQMPRWAPAQSPARGARGAAPPSAPRGETLSREGDQSGAFSRAFWWWKFLLAGVWRQSITISARHAIIFWATRSERSSRPLETGLPCQSLEFSSVVCFPTGHSPWCVLLLPGSTHPRKSHHHPPYSSLHAISMLTRNSCLLIRSPPCHWGAGACPEKGSEAGEGSGEEVLWGAAGGAGAVQSGEEEAEGRPSCSLQLPDKRV